ncbi:MAG: hypothetical protein JSS89_09885 [Bacteroidetes bacterium]|nr:hypothetical protein [Bacteroidota bacterium]
MTPRLVLVVVAFFVTSTLLNAQVPLPALPRTESVETCPPDTTGYRRITVGPVGRDHTDLQAAIDEATLGTVIILDAGAEFAGSFSLPEKTIGSGWIILTTSRAAELPPINTYVTPDHAALMPRIITTNTSGLPAFYTRARAHHYRLVGLEITAATTVQESYGLMFFGDASAAQSTLDVVPHHLVIDHCFVHGHDEGTIMKFGVRLDCANAAVLDSYFADFHSIGFDAQAIAGVNGPGPFKIMHNYLAASGENIMFGGAAPAIAGLVPSDIEIRRNVLFKPFSWRVGHKTYAGKHWTIKNHFELKTGRRVLFDGNTLENCWADLPIGQSGYAILLTVRNEGGKAPQAEVSDVTISNNVVRRVGAGITLSGTDDTPSMRTSRIHIVNNRFIDIDGSTYGDGNDAGPNVGTFLKIGDPENVIVDRNSISQSGAITWAYKPMNGFVFTNNVANCMKSAGGYRGIYGPGKTEGNGTLAYYFADITDANKRFENNALVGGDPSFYTNYATQSRNIFPANANALPSGIGIDRNQLDSAFAFKRRCQSITSVPDAAAVTADTHLWPNPASNEVTLAPCRSDITTYRIVDAAGRTVSSGPLCERTTISTSDLGNGVYTILQQSPHHCVALRLVIAR